MGKMTLSKEEKVPQKTHVYRVFFVSQGQVYEVYAREIYQSDLYGFIEVEEFIFNNRSQLVVDPGEERLKTEFTGVARSYLPIHTILRIDEVEKEGVPKITDAGKLGSNVAHFPQMPNFGSASGGDRTKSS
jgi:hypothetical protein